MKRILFLCHGNICRSPMAEFVFKEMIRQRGLENEYYVESAAVSTEELGNPLYPPARRCLTGHDIPFDLRRTARQVRAGDYDRFDMIICMDHSNLNWLRRIIPSDPEGKVCIMMPIVGKSRDVADPWYTGDFEATYRDIVEVCTAMLDRDFPSIT
ncbi:MAG: low molecular weight phosphotyrosine protein phosphatase [Bacteroidaceae bacterium]|nr:low molecular weight phosphotyrosine protein phosphatase [Bacteroidaceae bacterium]